MVVSYYVALSGLIYSSELACPKWSYLSYVALESLIHSKELVQVNQFILYGPLSLLCIVLENSNSV